MEGDPVAQLLCDFLRQIEPQPWRLLGQVAIVAGEAPLKDAKHITIFDPNPAIFYIESLVFKIDFNSTSAGVLEAIGQELLDNDQEPLAIGDDLLIQIMQIHGQVLLDKKEGVFANYFFDQIFYRHAL